MKRTAGFRSLILLGVLAAACGGNAFTASDSPSSNGGAGGTALGGGGSNAGSPAQAGSVSGGAPTAQGGNNAGRSAVEAAGSVGLGEAGAGGGATPVNSCAALLGTEFGDDENRHCYVDITVAGKTATQPNAAKACRVFATAAQRTGYLLVLNSLAEETSVQETFMAGMEGVSDAWLSLTCDEVAQPDINSCYCKDCTSIEQEAKRKAWKGLDGSSATYGWIGDNPDNGYRCAALSYNSTVHTWGWADRNCSADTFTIATDPDPHSYRTICELE